MITTNARDKQARLFGAAVTEIGFGTGTATPTPGDNSITNGYWKPVSSITYPATGQVSFNWNLTSNEANGKTITEMALRTSDGVIVARKTRGAISKDSDLSLSGSWVIKF